MIFFNDKEERVKAPFIIDWRREEQINQPTLLEVSINGETIQKGYRIFFDGDEYIVTGVIQSRGHSEIYRVEAERSEVELDGYFLEMARPLTTPDGALLEVLAGTRFTPGSVDVGDVVKCDFYRETRFSALQRLANLYGTEYKPSYTLGAKDVFERKINLYQKLGADRGKRCTWDKDLESVTRIIENDRIVTRLYVYGAGVVGDDNRWERGIDISSVNDGKEYLDDEEARLKYGLGAEKRHLEGVIKFTEIDDVEELKARGLEYLSEVSKPRVLYEASIEDLEAMGLEHEGVGLGDVITIIDKEFRPELLVKARVHKITSYKNGLKTVELGSWRPLLEQTLAEQKSNIESLLIGSGIWSRVADDVLDKRINYLEGVLEEINRVMDASGGHANIIEGRGLVVLNHPDESQATEIVEIGGGFIRIANSRTPDGNWDYRLLSSGSGVVADSIIAGILKGGSVRWNLETGSFIIGDPADPSLSWDGVNLDIKGDTIDISANQEIITRVTSAQMDSAIAGATSGLASKSYVEDAIEAINRANPNLVSNRSEKWEQGNIVGGVLTASDKHIRTQSYFPIRAGAVTTTVNPLYEVALVFYDENYNYISTTGFSGGQTTSISANSFFKAVIRRVGGTEDILPLAIDTAELKVENADTATQWTPYFGDLTLEEQEEFYSVILTSTHGWTVGDPDFTTTLNAKLLLFNQDITATRADSITWYRKYYDETKTVIGSGDSYTVTSAETEKSATYEVVFDIPINIFYLTTKGGDRLMTKSNEHLIATGIEEPAVQVVTSMVLVRDDLDRIKASETRIEQLSTSISFVINGARHTFTDTSYEFRDADGNVIMSNALGMANEQNLMKHDDCESGFPLIIPFHIGSNTSSIYEVVIQWTVSPFRATAKSASAGGGQTSGASSASTTASGGATTSGASSATTTASGGATTSGASSSDTSASGGGGTSGASSSSTSDWTGNANVRDYATGRHYDFGDINSHFHYYGLPSHRHSMYHTHSVYAHTHGMAHTHTIPAHTHNMAHTHTIPAHSHGMEHTHTISAHVHDLIFGVVELNAVDNNLEFWIDGVFRGSVNAKKDRLIVTPYVQTSGWHEIEIRTPTLKRIDANIFIKSYIRR